MWSYFEKGRLVRQGQDTKGRGKPDVFNHLNESGQVTIQEVSSNGQPDRKLYLDAAGQVTAQCTLNEKGKRLNTRAILEGGMVVEVLVDTTGNGVADVREVYQNGQRIRLDADTNGDRMPDVVQSVAANGASVQEEDVDFDGQIDHRFEGDQPVELSNGHRIQGEKFGRVGCGSFHRFWWKR